LGSIAVTLLPAMFGSVVTRTRLFFANLALMLATWLEPSTGKRKKREEEREDDRPDDGRPEWVPPRPVGGPPRPAGGPPRGFGGVPSRSEWVPPPRPAGGPPRGFGGSASRSDEGAGPSKRQRFNNSGSRSREEKEITQARFFPESGTLVVWGKKDDLYLERHDANDVTSLKLSIYEKPGYGAPQIPPETFGLRVMSQSEVIPTDVLITDMEDKESCMFRVTGGESAVKKIMILNDHFRNRIGWRRGSVKIASFPVNGEGPALKFSKHLIFEVA
jgi:hypothetical protein